MSTNTQLFDGMVIFVKVVELGNFSLVAEHFGHSPSYISKEINKLEKRLGTRLLNRTTRSLSLTDAGHHYFDKCQQLVLEAEDAEMLLNQQQIQPRGVLKLNAPVSFGLTYLAHALPVFMRQYPEIQLEVELNEKKVDLVSEGIDVAIRIGQLADSNLIARKFMQSKGVVVASKDYLKTKGTPQTPEELTQHDCISYSLQPQPNMWLFNKAGQTSKVQLKPKFISNSAELELAMAMAGQGISRLPYFCCEQAIKQGDLVTLFDDFEQKELGIYALYPHRQYMPNKLKVFIEFLQDYFKS